MLWVVMDTFLLVYGNNRVKKRVAFLKQCRMMEMVTHFPRFFEALFTGVRKASYGVYDVFKFNA